MSVINGVCQSENVDVRYVSLSLHTLLMNPLAKKVNAEVKKIKWNLNESLSSAIFAPKSIIKSVNTFLCNVSHTPVPVRSCPNSSMVLYDSSLRMWDPAT